MRRRDPKPKDLRELSFPGHLIEFLGDVQTQIEIGAEAAQIESDDLFQYASAYGGLDEEGGDSYSFTFFPVKGEIRHKWEFSFTKKELGSIRAGALSSLQMWCCRAPGCHSAFRSPDDTCFYCDWEPE